MQTNPSQTGFKKGQHPDILDQHPQELYRATDGSYRVIFRTSIRPGAHDNAALVAAVQVPSSREGEKGLWHSLYNTTLREELMFSVRLLLARRDPRWGPNCRIPRTVIRKTVLPDILFSRLLMLPHDLTLAAGWDLEEFRLEADKRLAEVREWGTMKSLSGAAA